MRHKAGRVFSIVQEDPPVAGCTVSDAVLHAGGLAITHFSLAAHTDISAESYGYPKLLLCDWGAVEVYDADGHGQTLEEGAMLATPIDAPVGARTQNGCVHTEITLTKETTMNETLKAGEVVRLADLLPCQDGKIVNMDLAHNDGMKLALMSFGAGTGLDEHAAPGDALVFALDGQATIGYEGQEHVISAGENFKFDKGGRHYVRADRGTFKMALLVTFG